VNLPRSFVFTDLGTAGRKHAKLLEAHLHQLVLPTEWKLQALAAALRQNGVLVHVPRGVEVELPLHVLFSSLRTAAFPHLLIVAEENSSVTVVQETRSADDLTSQLVSGAVEIYAGPNARVRFFDVERWGASTWSFSTVRAKLDRGAELTTATVGLGGKLTRTKTEALLAGEGSQADLLGVSFGGDRQHFDYQTLQEHLAPRTRSDLLYTAALTDRASEVWYGTARIHKGASQSDANQTSRNLLLSPTAKAAPIPVLEIEAYDILRCSHGAAAGPVDEEQLFYLESRGIPPAEAERLLVEAFFQPVLDRIPDGLRERVGRLLAAKIGVVDREDA
jgi:Fe-S cluster assembly protein SufD